MACVRDFYSERECVSWSNRRVINVKQRQCYWLGGKISRSKREGAALFTFSLVIDQMELIIIVGLFCEALHEYGVMVCSCVQQVCAGLFEHAFGFNVLQCVCVCVSVKMNQSRGDDEQFL